MSVPKKKMAKSRSKKRRTATGLKKVNLSKCGNCNTPKKPHVVCPSCGTYKGKEVDKKMDKKIKKLSAKSKSAEKKQKS